MLFYWYFLLHFNYYIRPKETTPDSTQSRDYQTDQQTLPEMLAPDTEVLITVRPQINFLQHNCITEIFNVVTFTANATHIIPTFPNLPVTVNTLHISDAPRLHRDKQLEEFLTGEECCHNFINQDLTFLQPSTVYEASTQEKSILPESNPTEVPSNTSQQIDQPQEEDSNPSQASLAELFYDRTTTTNRPAPIQPVEPVVGLTPKEQQRKEEDPNLTLDELLGLSSCEDHISTLQMLDRLYVNQPSRFLPLAQEAKKLAKRIKEEEEASQWLGIPVEQLLNNSFTEQLNCIQSLQQIAPLHSTTDHLPQDIITILERLGKVENIPFDKLYYLAENCADCYYTSIIKTFVKILKRSATDRQIILVNTARAIKYLEDFGQRQLQLFTVLEKYHLVPDSLENLQSQFHFLKEATSRNVENLQQAITVQQTNTANLYTYINNILPFITKLEDTILKFEQKLTMEQDTIQINALDFDPDIDGPSIPRALNNTVVLSLQEQLISPEPELSDATNFQEETTDRDPPNTAYNDSEESHGHDNFSQHIPNHTPVQHFMGQHQIDSSHTINSEEIPQLEEDWDDRQFANADTNLINRHNTHSESERIRKEYTQHLLDLSDNQYYYKEKFYQSAAVFHPRPSKCSALACTWKRKMHSSPQT